MVVDHRTGAYTLPSRGCTAYIPAYHVVEVRDDFLPGHAVGEHHALVVDVLHVLLHAAPVAVGVLWGLLGLRQARRGDADGSG